MKYRNEEHLIRWSTIFAPERKDFNALKPFINPNLWPEEMLQAAIYELEIWVENEDSIDRCRGVCFKF